MTVVCVNVDNEMHVEIAYPDSNTSARDYIFRLILGEFLGLKWLRTPSATGDILMRFAGATGEVRLPDCFLRHSDGGWLKPEALPTLPLANWDTRDLSMNIPLTDPIVPVLYGDAQPASRVNGDTIHLPIDIFGSAFFMLSRYEEAVVPDRDQHDRFPASASVAYKAAFLDRPIIDEYVEILWSAMHRLWPGLNRRAWQPRTVVSCDVDQPFAYKGTIMNTGWHFANDLMLRRSPALARHNLANNLRALRGDHSDDPYRNNIDLIMEMNERAGNPVSFYFIPENTDPKFDKRVSLDEPRMRALLRHVHERGHEIGLHPGYNTYKHPEAFARSVATLRRVLDEERIDQPGLGGRQHYLRWETPTTARLWHDNGLNYDSTLSYADRSGFRCGTSREYKMFDVIDRCELSLVQRPLILMECSVIASQYMGLGYDDAALELMLKLKERALRFGGQFTLLWHNSHFSHPKDEEFFRTLIQS